MGTEIVNSKVDELLNKFSHLTGDAQIDEALKYINNQLKEYPLVVLFHEMKKELIKRKS